MTGNDHVPMSQHQRGERLEVRHACPDCPMPGGALYVPPSAVCRWCGGTGLVDGATLAAWQRHAFDTIPT